MSTNWTGLVLVGFLVVMFFAIAWGYFTAKGSGVAEHPASGQDRTPGAKEPASASGSGRTPEPPPGEGSFSRHGTRWRAS